MKGVQFNIVLVIVILSLITLIGVAGYYYVTDIQVTDYLTTTFTSCGLDEGSVCCNLENLDLEPFCSGGMECFLNVAPSNIKNPSLSEEERDELFEQYKNSKCSYMQGNFIFDVDHYVYDDSCLNGEDCNVTALSRDWFIHYLRWKDGIQAIHLLEPENSPSDTYIGGENCENAIRCTDCSRYYDFGESSFCSFCEFADADGNNADCLECDQSIDPETNQVFGDCSFCTECSECVLDEETNIAECEKCENCNSCFTPETNPLAIDSITGELADYEQWYCKESDKCNTTTCLNNFYCGNSATDYNEEIFCRYCEPASSATVCEKQVDYKLCDEIKDCLRYHDGRDDVCPIFERFAPVIYDSSDLNHPYTSPALTGTDVERDALDLLYNDDEFMDTFEEQLLDILDYCVEEDIYSVVEDAGIQQKLCHFDGQPTKTTQGTTGAAGFFSMEDADQPYFVDGESYGTLYLPNFLPDYTYDKDFKFQDQKFTFSDCGNLSGLSPILYEIEKSDGGMSDDIVFFNRGGPFESDTMPNGTSIKMAVSDMSYFDGNGENNCDFNFYVCSQPMLVDKDNQNALGIYTGIRDMFETSMFPTLDKSDSEWSERITRTPITSYSAISLHPEIIDQLGFDGPSHEYDSYLVTFDDSPVDLDSKSDGLTTFEIDIGSEPMDAEHIANIIVAGIRDWSIFVENPPSEIYDNIQSMVCYGTRPGRTVSECVTTLHYDFDSQWNLRELDYSNIPDKFYKSSVLTDIRYGAVSYKKCSKDLIGGVCSSEATEHSCWGSCDDHEYELNEGRNIQHLNLEHHSGKTEDCESQTVIELKDTSGKTKYDYKSEKHASYLTKKYSLGLSINGQPSYSDIDKLTITNKDCYVDGSEFAIYYDTLKESEYNKNIFYVKEADGLYSGKIKVYLGFIVQLYQEYGYDEDYSASSKELTGREAAVVHPIVKFRQG
ncbi:MAG: hypothetical protein GOV02_00980 [Candidatus Aenigmarchaeota archaeon]|nr:hypothetical protein [Candidatus Aenigmarchaeota archaeon]